MSNPHVISDRFLAQEQAIHAGYEKQITELKNRIFTLEVENRQLRQIREAAAKAEPVIRQCHENLTKEGK